MDFHVEMVVQWLRLHTSKARGMGSISGWETGSTPAQGTKILHDHGVVKKEKESQSIEGKSPKSHS